MRLPARLLSARGGHPSDAGFTLVELLISIVILGVVVGPLTGVVIGFLTSSDSTARRMNESHDAQMAADYFAQDVQAVGVHDYSDPTKLDKPLLQSVETAVAPTAGNYPCGAAGLPAATVRLAWDEWDDAAVAAGTPTPVRVAYLVENGTELHRLVCRGSATPTSDVVVAHNVVSAAATCATSSGGTSCTGAGTDVPTSVSLSLTIRDPKNTTNYPVTLTGQRRQS
jgi:prepilin-type N-terminal cleavage/methylation domain-containing protein